jgi:hypothetical protein
MEEAKREVELLPISRDLRRGAQRVINLAKVYALLGRMSRTWHCSGSLRLPELRAEKVAGNSSSIAQHFGSRLPSLNRSQILRDLVPIRW